MLIRSLSVYIVSGISVIHLKQFFGHVQDRDNVIVYIKWNQFNVLFRTATPNVCLSLDYVVD